MKTEQMKQVATAATGGAGNRMAYTPPQVEIIKMEVEGTVMVASILDYEAGGSMGNQISTKSTYRGYNSASSSDLEDLINDILTVEQ